MVDETLVSIQGLRLSYPGPEGSLTKPYFNELAFNISA